MLQAIIDAALQARYDFRATAFAGDPLGHLFEEWVPYYRTKWAIAKVLQPKRILEIGVRYGYSTLAFLDACPESQYLGIDLDSAGFGGVPGAIEWARKAAQGFDADFVIADSQKMSSFPGGMYDLIHVDGQQDGDGSMHDLEIALGQGQYILVDGYFWTKTNFQAISEFLYCFRDRIEYYGVIPGYAGDLLIKPRPPVPPARRDAASNSEIQAACTASYFPSDGRGIDVFKSTRGSKPLDSRLRAVAELACTARTGRALDLGCGRGELSLFLAAQGFEVTAIDHSADAIHIARQALADACDPALRVRFIHCDLNQAPLEGLYDVAAGADVIEHLAPEELDRLYARLAAHLSPDGLVVLHTYPNSWFYRFDYPRRRRTAESVGAYLPANPRSHFERLMHINEQSPAALRRQLRRHFGQADVWFAGHDCERPFENLVRRYTRAEMRAAADLFAVASHSHSAKDRVLGIARMEAKPESEPVAVSIGSIDAPRSAPRAAVITVRQRVTNSSGSDWNSQPPYPIHLCYHWLHGSGGCVVYDGRRTRLFPALRHGTTREYLMEIETPAIRGDYVLRIAFVQEGIRWMDDPATGLAYDSPILIA